MPTPAQPAVVPLFKLPQTELEACTTEQEKKQFLGNYLYQFVTRYVQEHQKAEANAESLAGKVTGMLLDGQTIEYILYLFQDRSAFYGITKEAIALIQQAEESPAKWRKCKWTEKRKEWDGIIHLS